MNKTPNPTSDDSRVNALRVFLYEHCCVGEKEKLAPLLLTDLDAAIARAIEHGETK